MSELNKLAPGLSQQEAAGLAAEFPAEVLDENNGFTYIPVEYVIDRLNKVFNYNWDCVPTEITLGEKETRTNKKGNQFTVLPVYATVLLTVRSSTGAVITRVGSGGNVTGYGKSEGDGHKGAVSDALKKAAQSLGVGLYIAMEGRAARKAKRGNWNRNNQSQGVRPPMGGQPAAAPNTAPAQSGGVRPPAFR